MRRLSEVARFLRRFLEIVVPPVDPSHGRGDEVGGVDVVEAGEVDRVELVVTRERPQAAVLAEAVTDGFRAEPVFRQIGFAGDQAETIALDRREPVPPLGADRAVALHRAFRQVHVGLETHGAAVAASPIGLLHGCGSSESTSVISLQYVTFMALRPRLMRRARASSGARAGWRGSQP